MKARKVDRKQSETTRGVLKLKKLLDVHDLDVQMHLLRMHARDMERKYPPRSEVRYHARLVLHYIKRLEAALRDGNAHRAAVWAIQAERNSNEIKLMEHEADSRRGPNEREIGGVWIATTRQQRELLDSIGKPIKTAIDKGLAPTPIALRKAVSRLNEVIRKAGGQKGLTTRGGVLARCDI